MAWIGLFLCFVTYVCADAGVELLDTHPILAGCLFTIAVIAFVLTFIIDSLL